MSTPRIRLGFPTDPRTEEIPLTDGSSFDLRIAPIANRIADATVRMLAYNFSVPGPTLRVPEGARVAVNIANDGDLETTVHWHGLRLENRFDGTHQTQSPIPVGGNFTAYVEFPDPGVYWYHPHIRQDYSQELGLYGAVVVDPSDPSYWSPVNRDLVLTLDDIMLEDGRIAPFSRSHPTHTAMGRFGDVILVSGVPDLQLDARVGEVVRFYLVNTANTRVFRFAAPGTRMKLVGGDSGRCEQEEYVDEVILAPSERVVLEVLFTDPGIVELFHRTPSNSYTLAGVNVTDEPAAPSFAREFENLRRNDDMAAERARIASHLDTRPDKTLAFIAEMSIGAGAEDAATYVCPMHLDVTSDGPGRCPKCGMKLLPAAMVLAAGGQGAPGNEHHDHHEMDPHEGSDGIEWEDDMVEVNKMSTPYNMHWSIVDVATDAQNQAIDWHFKVGEQVKIRLVNELDSDHPMHHPFHVHGAGRFLVLRRDGVVEPNLVWKDTVLVRTGQTVDILLDVTNPGTWMAHCHIAEHHEGGMMFSFRVDPSPSTRGRAQ